MSTIVLQQTCLIRLLMALTVAITCFMTTPARACDCEVSTGLINLIPGIEFEFDGCETLNDTIQTLNQILDAILVLQAEIANQAGAEDYDLSDPNHPCLSDPLFVELSNYKIQIMAMLVALELLQDMLCDEPEPAPVPVPEDALAGSQIRGIIEKAVA